jgi:hypothetical protein
MSDSPREQNITFGQTPAHPLAPIQKEAIRNSSSGPASTVHEYAGEVTRAQIEKRLEGHRFERAGAGPTK